MKILKEILKECKSEKVLLISTEEENDLIFSNYSVFDFDNLKNLKSIETHIKLDSILNNKKSDGFIIIETKSSKKINMELFLKIYNELERYIFYIKNSKIANKPFLFNKVDTVIVYNQHLGYFKILKSRYAQAKDKKYNYKKQES